MQKSKLFGLLSVVKSDEWSDLMHHIKTKRGVRPQVKQLSEFLYKRRKNLQSKVLDIDHVRTNYFDGMSRINFQNIMSKVCKLVEEYFILHSVLHDEAEMELRLFQELNERGSFELANKSASKSIDKWKNDESLNISLLLNILRIQHKQYFSHNPIKYQFDSQIIRRMQDSLAEINQIHSAYYAHLKATAIRREQRMATIFQQKNDTSAISQSLDNIIFHLDKMFEERSQESFDYLYVIILNNLELDKELRAIIYNKCRNFLTYQLSNNSIGNRKKMVLKLYDFGIEQEILTYNGALAPVNFQNIIQIACYLKEFDWAISFRENSLDLVPSKEKDENAILSKAQILFEQKKYEEVISLISTSDINHFSLRLLSRWLLLSSHFIRHDSIEFFGSQLDSYTQFIYYNKSKLSYKNIESSLNLAKIFRSHVSLQEFDLELEVSKYELITFKNRLPDLIADRKRYVKENGIVMV